MKIKTVNPNGAAAVIFARKDNEEMVELYHFYLNELVDREILTVD